MSQTRSLNYNRGVTSFDENKRFAAILPTGRYRGFDTFNDTAALTFELQHTAIDGFKYVDESEAYGNYSGVYKTPQGVIISEDAAITGLVCGTNAANAFERIDIVVATHEWNNTPGGDAATYSVIQGANGGPVIPAMTNPEKQTIIGYVYIPASASTLAAATWVMAETPSLGGANFARRDLDNIFTHTQTYQYTPAGQSVIAPDGSDVLTLTDGNIFLVNDGTNDIDMITNKGNGTPITLIFSADVLVVHDAPYIDLGPGHVDTQGKTFKSGTVAQFVQIAEAADDTYGIWKLTSSLGLVEALVNSSTFQVNAHNLTADRLVISVTGDTGGGKTTVLTDNKADTFETNPRTISLPKRTGRLPVYVNSGQDVWNDHAHSAGDYTAGAGAWAVSGGNLLGFKYQIMDKTMRIHCNIASSVTSGTATNYLMIALPGGATVNGFFYGSGQSGEASTYRGLTVRAENGDAFIQILHDDNSNFYVGTIAIMHLSIELQIN